MPREYSDYEIWAALQNRDAGRLMVTTGVIDDADLERTRRKEQFDDEPRRDRQTTHEDDTGIPLRGEI